MSSSVVANGPSASWRPHPAFRRLDHADALRDLRRRRVLPWLAANIGSWAVIATAIAVAQAWPCTLPLALLAIASRQHALAVLMHDGAHGIICNSAHGNLLLANLLAAWPLGITTQGFRRSHIAHHAHTHTTRDPDLVRKLQVGAADWHCPMSRAAVMTLLLRDICGRGLWNMARRLRWYGSAGTGSSKTTRAGKALWKIGRLLFFVALACALTLGGWWYEFAVYWLVPLLLLLPAILRVRSLAEHFALPHASDLTSSRDTDAPWLARQVFGPCGINWHLVHHLYPDIPFHALQRAHRQLRSVPTYARHGSLCTAYLFGPSSVLAALSDPGNAPPPRPSPDLRAEAEALNVAAFRRIAFAAPVREISRLQPLRSFAAITFDWACIVAIALGSQRFAPAWSWPFAWLLIATRQHALLIVMHDASHGLLLRRRSWNDAIADVFCAWPMFVHTASYRESHLRHHRFLNTERDPDLVRKVSEPGGRIRWLTSKSRWRTMRELLLDVLGRGMIEMLAKLRRFQRQGGATLKDSRHSGHQSRTRSARRLAYYTVAGLVITWCQAWDTVAVFWIVPLFTFLPAILRLRSLAEHFGLAWEHELTSARAVHSGPLQRFLFGPHWICLHLHHHLFPSVPWYHLPALHRVLVADPEFARRAAVSRGYLWGEPSVLNELATTTAEAPWQPNV